MRLLLVIIIIIIVIITVIFATNSQHDRIMAMAGNTDFKWETLGDNYDFDPQLNYLIYYRGMFGPPTRGHFALVERFMKHSNVHVLIDQIGSARRHGVPYELNKEIWQIYINELLPANKITLVRAREFDIEDHLDGIDKILYIRGYEDDLPVNEDYYTSMYKDWLQIIDIDFLFIDRTKNNVSTTKFIKALNTYKTRANRDNLNTAKKYLPDSLKENTKMTILKKLLKHKLH